MVSVYRMYSDGSISVKYMDNSKVTIDSNSYPPSNSTSNFLSRRTVRLPRQPFYNSIEWIAKKDNKYGDFFVI